MRSPSSGIGRIFNGFWPASSHEALGDRVVVLRDLQDTRGNLTGPYAKVIDEIDPYWKAESHQLTDLPSDDLLTSIASWPTTTWTSSNGSFVIWACFVWTSMPILNPLHVHLVDRKQRARPMNLWKGICIWIGFRMI